MSLLKTVPLVGAIPVCCRIALFVAFLALGAVSNGVEANYRYYRFQPSKLRDTPGLSNSVQISEFGFSFRGKPVSMANVTVTNPEGNNPTAEPPSKVIDNNTATKWLDFNKQALVFAFPARTPIDSYNFATANDSAERDPVSWRLEGSDNGSSWTRIDEVNDFPTTTLRLTYQAGFNLPASAQVPGDPVSPQWHPHEILSWSPATDSDAPFNRSTVPLASRLPQSAAFKVNPHARVNEARVMPLIAFNTIPGASAQGSRTLRYYTPLFWQYMHSMTFWGGSDRDTRTILAPSAHVVDAAHRNGVPVLGKIFFAFSSEASRLAYVRSFLRKSGDTFPVADKLIEVANYFGFEGWFINQETSGTNATDAQNMRDFLKYFRAKAPNLEIMWYDAMVESGARSFQNALTTQNDGYLKEANALVAHTMFLNFWWGSPFNDTTNMPNSRQLALNLGLNPYDIYAGIDTEGRGYDADVDWNSLFPEGQAHRLSLGIYRPEWTFNYSSSTSSFHTRERRYWVGEKGDPRDTTSTSKWKGISYYIPDASAITRLPFVTNFNLGQGNRYAINGTTLMSTPWSNLSVQDILPTWRWIVDSGSANKLTPSIELDDAYYGGASLKVAGILDATNDIKLYRCSLPVTSNTNLRIVYKRGSATTSAMQVGIAFEDSPNTFQFLDVGTATSSSWNTKSFSLGTHAGKKIAIISLRFSNPSAISNYSMRVGQLAIYEDPTVAPAPPTNVAIERQDSLDAETLSLRLKWTHSSNAVQFYNVYLRNPDNTRVWLGATPNNMYFVPAARRKGLETTLNIEVETVAPDFEVSTRAQVAATLPAGPSTKHQISGTVIGTTGAINNSSNTRDKVFDGNVATFFDAPTSDDAWAGLDLGVNNERVVTAVRYYPRSGWSSRMIGGLFQGSNNPDFSSAVTLAAIWVQPLEGAYTTIAVDNPTRFRYLRYLSPDGGHCNVAEVRFFGVPIPTAPTTLTGKMVDGSATLAWGASTYASTYNVKRSTSNGGPYTVVGSNINSTAFTDPGLSPNGTYHYVVSSVNEAGEGADSTQVTVSDAYLQWTALQGKPPGSPGAGFNEDANGNGVLNGVEYAVPAGLQFASGADPSAITAEVRIDPSVTVTLLESTNLVDWIPVTFSVSANQSGVPSGFQRWTSPQPAASGTEKKFYRLRLTR